MTHDVQRLLNQETWGVGALKSHAGGVKYELKLKARERHTLFHYYCTLYVQTLHVLQIDTIRYHSWVLATLYLDIFNESWCINMLVYTPTNK